MNRTAKIMNAAGGLILAAMVVLPLLHNAPPTPLTTSAQGTQQQVQTQPDCMFVFTFNTAATAALPAGNGLDNRQQGCNTWSIVYTNSGFSPVSVTLQTAANNNGTAASWGTGFPVQQSIIAGANPASDTTGGYLWIVGQNAFVRVQATTSGSGTLTGSAFGWRIPNAQ